LLTDAARGQAGAVARMLDDIGPVVYGFIFARVGGDAATAEDLLQETFVESMRSAHTFRGDSTLSTWMRAIARRRIARYWEAERKAEVARSGLRPVEAEPERIERRDEIVRALGRLPALHRQVLVMKYLDDLSVAEIGASLAKPRVQVQSLLQRAREGFRREMELDDE
jgi:RNA polymerase sigma-70 factor (ECF subfamily)